jgi:Protein of unknown function (DUF2439)
MNATARGTPSLSITPAQNTAPVHEFRCMFSHDLRKKKKTWHDGSLRFHTFNKRVMVYDEVKNFVGDLHYRVAGEFGEGTELQLDRGVLVQVEARIGQTETDLAPLLEKRRPEDGTNGANIANVAPGQHGNIPQLPRHGPAYSQGRPKSLAAVLGTSQGLLGRARLPVRSPYEQRHAVLVPTLTDAPPAKRQRITTGKENGKETEELIPRKETTKAKSRNVELKSPLSERQNVEPRAVIDISSDDKPSATKGLSRKVAAKAVQDPGPISKPAPRASKPKIHRIQPPDRPSPNNSLQSNTSVDSVTPWVRPSLPGKTQLRLAAEKPRPKLMYRALLPSSAALSGASPCRDNQKSKHSTLLAKGVESTSDAFEHADSEIFDIDDMGELEAEELQPPPPPDHSNMTPIRPRIQTKSARFSPLFCSPPIDRREDDLPDLSQNDMVIPSSVDEQLLLSPTLPESLLERRSNVTLQKGHTRRDPVTRSDQLTLPDQRLMPSPQSVEVFPEQLQKSSRPRPCRRVVSEGDLHAPNDLEQDSMSNIPTALASMKTKQNQFLKIHKSPTNLRRSISDASGLVSPTKIAVMPAEDDAIQESGPWTGVEAFLLFDWWPPGREKPQYGETAQRMPENNTLRRTAR